MENFLWIYKKVTSLKASVMKKVLQDLVYRMKNSFILSFTRDMWIEEHLNHPIVVNPLMETTSKEELRASYSREYDEFSEKFKDIEERVKFFVDDPAEFIDIILESEYYDIKILRYEGEWYYRYKVNPDFKFRCRADQTFGDYLEILGFLSGEGEDLSEDLKETLWELFKGDDTVIRIR